MVLIKLGEKGSRLINEDFDLYMPAMQYFNNSILQDYSVVDTTGAGDAFISAFVVKYLELFMGCTKASKNAKHKLEMCLLFGNATGFLSIT